MRRSFDPATLARLQRTSCEDVLDMLAVHVSEDRSYIPAKDQRSRRWHIRTARGEFEILTTRVKWYDTRAGKGSGGAIDLAMHLLGLSFVDAVKLLIGRPCGLS